MSSLADRLVLPNFALIGLQLVRATITHAGESDNHDAEWVLFGMVARTKDAPALVVASDFHQVSDGALLGCSAHAIIGCEASLGLSYDTPQEDIDDVTEKLAPWLSECLWDFGASTLRGLAGTSWASFDLPMQGPKYRVERISHPLEPRDDR